MKVCRLQQVSTPLMVIRGSSVVFFLSLKFNIVGCQASHTVPPYPARYQKYFVFFLWKFSILMMSLDSLKYSLMVESQTDSQHD